MGLLQLWAIFKELLMNLNQITLPSSNIAESIAFYKRMGFKQIVDSEAYARFESIEGDATFSVEYSESISNLHAMVIYFEVENLTSTYNKLLKKGISFNGLPEKEPWLWEEVRLTDPTGNEICIYHAGSNRKNPPWRIGGKG